MFNFGAGVVVEHRRGGQAEVFCNRCGDSIGSMAIGDVMRAIFRTLGRGGVLCPPCRLLTCDGCGLLQAKDTLVVVRGPTGAVRVCRHCDAHLKNVHNDFVEALLDDADTVILFSREDIPQ